MDQNSEKAIYKVNTDVSLECRDVFHRELHLRKLNGEPDLRVKDVTAEWMERMAEQRAPELDQLVQQLATRIDS